MADKILNTKTAELIEKLSDSRTKLESYSVELEEMKEKVSSIFPKEMNYRSKWVVEEKVKAVSEFFNSLLRVRVEINKTIKDEITLRENASKVNKTEKFTEEDVRTLAQEIDDLEKEE